MTGLRSAHLLSLLLLGLSPLPSMAQTAVGEVSAESVQQDASLGSAGYYPTWQTSTTTMRTLPGWEPTFGQAPTTEKYGTGYKQGGFSRGVDRFLGPLVPREETWNASVWQNHYAGDGTTHVGESGAGVTSIKANSGLWFDRGFDPRMAEVKAGPLFLDFNSLEAIALWSDVDGPFADHLPEDGFIAMFGLNLSAFIQITSQTYFKATGTLYYVPTENQVGFFFGSGGNTYAEFEHRFDIGRWDVRIYDQFDVFHPLSYLLSDLSRSAFDQSGFYRVGYNYAFTSDPWKGDNVFFRNIAGVEATTYFAHDFRFRVGYEHWETWKTDNFDRLTPVDHLSAGLFYEDNVSWYRPWLIYDGYFYNDFTDPFQQVLAGVTLPFTRSLTGFVRAGHAWDDGGVFGQDAGNFVWDVGLTHYINSTWSHAVQTGYSYQIGPSSDDQSFGYYASYAIRFQPQRSRYHANALVQWQREEWNASNNWLAGIQGGYILDPRTSIDANIFYFNHDTINNVESEAWLYRLQLTRTLTNSLVARLIYQFTENNTTVADSEYTDHLLMLSLTKYF